MTHHSYSGEGTAGSFTLRPLRLREDLDLFVKRTSGASKFITTWALLIAKSSGSLPASRRLYLRIDLELMNLLH
jgi:hypothetical protein